MKEEKKTGLSQNRLKIFGFEFQYQSQLPVLWVWIFRPDTVRSSSPIFSGTALVTLYTDSWNLKTWTPSRGSKHSSAPVPKSVKLRKTTRSPPQGPIPVDHPLSPTLTLTLVHDQPKRHPSCSLTRNLVLRRNNFQSKQAASVVGRDLPDSRDHPTHPLATWVLGSSAQVRRSTTYLPWSAAAYNVYRPFPAGYLFQTNYTFNLYYLGQLHFGSVRGSSSSILLQISEMNVFLQTLAITGLLIKSGLTQDN